MSRVAIADFGVIQRLLAGATVTFFVADEFGRNTGIVATLYQAESGENLRNNPQVLNEDGMLSNAIWVESDIVASISNITERSERTLRKIRVNPLDYPLPFTNAALKAAESGGDADEAKQYAEQAAGSALSASNSAGTATAQAGIAVGAAGTATQKAQDATDAADLSIQYAVGLPSEPLEGSSKYWAEQAFLSHPVSVKAFGAVGDGTTDDTVAIQSAVSSALAASASLYWPAGTYVTSASIDDFHNVNHIGDGSIERGSDLFHISPKGSQKNTIYCSPSGADTNDGLSANEPKQTIKGLLDVMMAPYMDRMFQNGILRLKLSAGTWTEGGYFERHLGVENPVEIEGEVDGDGVPTTIIDGTSSVYTNGMYFHNGPSTFVVKNISANNFRQNSVSSGFVFFGGGIQDVWFDNLHTDNNLWAGINIDNVSEAGGQGGKHDNTTYDIRVRAARYSIGRQANPITLGQSATGIQVRSNSSGHLDYIKFDRAPGSGSGQGIWVVDGAYASIVGCEFENLYTGIQCDNNGTFTYTGCTFDTVAQEYNLRSGGTKGRGSQDGNFGGGLGYDKFLNRYEIGLDGSSLTPFSTTAHVRATTKTGTADDVFLVPNSTLARKVVGNLANNVHFRQDFNFTNNSYQLVINGAAKLIVGNSEVNGGADGGSNLGSGGARWDTVYATTGTINTSDAREKQQVRDLTDAERNVAVRLKGLIKAFKWNDAVDKKGAGARIHVGVMAQDVASAFEAEGLDPNDYAIFCYDEWPEIPEEKDDNGNIVQEYRPAGNRFGVRYDQLLAFIIGSL